MAETAAARIAAKLKARQEAAKSAPPAKAVEPDEPEEESLPTEDDALLPDDTKPKGTIAERAAARRAAKGKVVPHGAGTTAVAEAADDEDEDDEPAEEAIVAAAKTSKPSKAKAGTKPKGSPKQIAARAAFAERSRAAAEARRAAANGAAGAAKPASKKGPQTEAEVKAAQSAARAAARAAAASKPTPRATGASKPVVVQKPSKTAAAKVARAERVAAKQPTPLAKGGKASAKPKAASASPRSDTKAKVLAMWAKGSTRAQIMEALGLSYAAVFFHTRGVAGAGANEKGKIFVDTNLDESGKKLRNGKTVRVSRSEAMRRTYKSGETVGDTARAFDVKYQIAYTAIHPLIIAENEAE